MHKQVQKRVNKYVLSNTAVQMRQDVLLHNSETTILFTHATTHEFSKIFITVHDDIPHNFTLQMQYDGQQSTENHVLMIVFKIMQ